MLRVAIIATINSDKKTNNNSISNKILVKLFILTKCLRTKEIEEIRNCKYYSIDINFLKQISRKLRSKIEIYIKNKYLFTIYLIIRLILIKNFSNLYYISICKVAKYIILN